MDLAHFIDHTLLKPDSSSNHIKLLCEEAIQYQFAAVCVPPYYVKDVAHWLEKSPVKIATVVGFPLGYAATAAKVEEIKRAIDEGADELDAVVNICAVKNGNWNFVKNEIDSLTTASHMRGKMVKVILETGLLVEKEIFKLCDICTEAQVDFVKTSTGFAQQGATVEVISLLRGRLPKSIKIKASGGIRDRQFAEQLIQAGAERIGTSAGVQLVSGTAVTN
ncbi:MAG: deoxyribose-phosphate aldolase [Lewinellaceae bacterium]|nr:deoxyribose-phosphate aldolase [Saprospiraceae bacterium]MCB9340042.1 deoxyribose-phosphate aldolase [Lewinellaceae bacterium]